MSNKVEFDKELLASVGQVIMLLHNLIESGNQPYIQTRNTLHAARELHKIIQAACDAELGEAPPVVVGPPCPAELAIHARVAQVAEPPPAAPAPPHVLTIEEKIVLEDRLASDQALEDEQAKARYEAT